MYSIDIDVGGTFTDGFFSDGTAVKTGKVLTTPHDVTEGFIDCVQYGSTLFEVPLDHFLRRTAVARLSTTIGTNLLVQRKGSRIGLLVTAGFEQTRYQIGERSGTPGRDVIAPDMILAIAEMVDDDGQIGKAVDQEAVLAAVRTLVARGAQIIVVSLRNAWRNPVNEHAVRDAIRHRYPVHYLRSVPVQLGTDVVHDRDDYARTNSALLNAYIHAEMARILFRAEDKLRDAGYNRPLLIAHSSGGSARVAKTIALNTLHSGPALAVKAAAVLSEQLGLDRVVSGDMGGTSFDIGVVADREAARERHPFIEDLRVATPMIAVDSIGIGGGSIAFVEGGELRVGPQSAGSAPGPACYGKGGTEPTVTDANVVLGLIDPDFFLGGRMKLDRETARRAIQRRIATRLDVSVERAAYDILRRAEKSMSDAIVKRLASFAQPPRSTALFSAGGAGSLHACSIAGDARLSKVYAFGFSSVFSAYGGSTTDIEHLYGHAFSTPAETVESIADALAGLLSQATRDMQAEGFSGTSVTVIIQAETETGENLLSAAIDADATHLAKALLEKLPGKAIRTLNVVATSILPHWKPELHEPTTRQIVAKGTRAIFWDGVNPIDTPIYDAATLGCGHRMTGPAIVEAGDTTYAVPYGWTLSIDPLDYLVFARGELATA